MTTTITGALGIDNIKAATGAVLQVVSEGFPPQTITTTSTSFVTTGKSIVITPKSATSKILITLSGGGQRHAAQGSMANVTVYRGATNIGHASYGLSANYAVGSSSGSDITPHSLSVLDTPETNSSVTYTFYIKSQSGSYQFHYSDRSILTATLMEIAG